MNNQDWRKCTICGDSKEIIKRIPDNSIDFILTDPPYNISKYSTGNIHLDGRSDINNDIAEWDLKEFRPEEWADEFIRILKPTGNLFIFTTYNQIGKWHECLDKKFDTTNFMIWHKTNPAPKIYKAGFLNSCEMIFTCWNKKHTWNFISQKEMHNFIESPICSSPERLKDPKHPSQKPISILTKMITIASKEDDIVFDPFMGVGSVGVAAIKENRKFIGIEIDKKYFKAAKQRIDEELRNYIYSKNEEKEVKSDDCIMREPLEFPLKQWELDDLCHITTKIADNLTNLNVRANLSPVLKWPGGKEKELRYILPNLPNNINNYFEPFVGGGSVYTAMSANHYYINDLSEELMSLYQDIKTGNNDFFNYAECIDRSWENAHLFYERHKDLNDLYISFRNEEINEDELKKSINSFCQNNNTEINNIVSAIFDMKRDVLFSELAKNLFRKMIRMNSLEKTRHKLSELEIDDNIETAVKSSLYMYYRCIYNTHDIFEKRPEMLTSLFLFLRNYAYSGMFRFNGKGEFNVPYGGMAYNSKYMKKKLDYYHSEPLKRHLEHTSIYNCDFEDFLKKTDPQENDFIFLDPPYDSDFSTYDKNVFNHEDHQRLANFLLKETKAKWMMIIKYTDFIYNLYKDKEGVNINAFEKKYLVSFMNRNDKKATHLLITNY